MADIENSQNAIAAALSSDNSPEATRISEGIVEALVQKYNGETGPEFRQEARALLLILKKDNPQLRDSVMAGKVSPQQLVNMSNEERANPELQAEVSAIQEENLRSAVVTDELQPVPDQEDQIMDNEGGLKGQREVKVAGLEGIDYS